MSTIFEEQEIIERDIGLCHRIIIKHQIQKQVNKYIEMKSWWEIKLPQDKSKSCVRTHVIQHMYEIFKHTKGE